MEVYIRRFRHYESFSSINYSSLSLVTLLINILVFILLFQYLRTSFVQLKRALTRRYQRERPAESRSISA